MKKYGIYIISGLGIVATILSIIDSSFFNNIICPVMAYIWNLFKLLYIILFKTYWGGIVVGLISGFILGRIRIFKISQLKEELLYLSYENEICAGIEFRTYINKFKDNTGFYCKSCNSKLENGSMINTFICHKCGCIDCNPKPKEKSNITQIYSLGNVVNLSDKMIKLFSIEYQNMLEGRTHELNKYYYVP